MWSCPAPRSSHRKTEEYAEHGAFTAEELIDAHESLRKLNPDSVNTVRICTYNDNGRYVVHNSFAKIGRAGSFVDNGGAGGILVNIDKESGVMDSDGIDENCSHYTSHPDTGVTFRGFEYPEWNKALETALKAAAKLPDVKYIGWDLTYTAEKNG